MDSFYRPFSKYSVQLSFDSCWAAALESWLAIVPGRSWRPSQYELLQMFPGVTYTDGSLITREFTDRIAPQIGLVGDRISPAELTAEYLVNKLLYLGHLVILYQDTARDVRGTHVVVCHGVGRLTLADQLVGVMDPARGAGFQNRKLSYFSPVKTEGAKILIGWATKGFDMERPAGLSGPEETEREPDGVILSPA